MSALLEPTPEECLTGLLDRLLQEDLGITNLREVCGKKALKSLFTIQWDDLRVNTPSALQWAPENEALIAELQLHGYSQHLCNRTYLYSFYSRLCFQQRLHSIDPKATRLLGLHTLELQNNKIECLQNLPPNLKQLYMRNNCLSSVSLGIQCKSLQSLSLPYNRLDTQCLLTIVQLFPALLSLDLAYNRLTQLDLSANYLANLSELRLLSLKGNPLALHQDYSTFLAHSLPSLTQLDNAPLPSAPSSAPALPPVQLSIQVQTLENYTGSNHPIESIERPRQQSQFYFCFSFLGQEHNLKDKAVPIDEGQPDDATGQQRLNFNFNLEQTLELHDPAIVQALLDGLDIEVRALHPRTQTKEEEEEPQVVYTADQTGLEMDDVLLGVVHVDLSGMVHHQSRMSQYRHPLYPPSILDSYSLYYPHPDETALLQKHLADRPVLSRATSPTKKEPAGAKKGDAKKADPKKGKKEETARQAEVELLNYPIQRKHVFCQDKQEVLSGSDMLLALTVRLL